MKLRAKQLSCGLLLLALSTAVLAQDSLTARIPVAIAAGEYAQAETLITEAVRLGLISAASAAAYRGNLQRQQERAVADPPDKKQQEAEPGPEPKKKPGVDWPPLPYTPKQEIKGRIYVTYTKFNKKLNRYYAGRTSMMIDLRQPIGPQADEAVRLRDANHHIDESEEPKNATIGAAELERFDVGVAVDYNERYSDLAYWRIRGREQQLIDFRGGAQSDTGKPYQTENILRAVAKTNRLGKQFDEAATARWGRLYRYTGY